MGAYTTIDGQKCIRCGGTVLFSKNTRITDGVACGDCGTEYDLHISLLVPIQWSTDGESGLSEHLESDEEDAVMSFIEALNPGTRNALWRAMYNPPIADLALEASMDMLRQVAVGQWPVRGMGNKRRKELRDALLSSQEMIKSIDQQGRRCGHD